MNDAYRDKMEINDLTLLHSVFDKNSGNSGKSVNLEYPPSKPPFDSDKLADIRTLWCYGASQEFDESIRATVFAIDAKKKGSISPATLHWYRTLFLMLDDASISALNKLASGSQLLPDHPCEESVHVVSRIMASHWLKRIKERRDEEDRREWMKLSQLRQNVENKQAELSEKESDLQRHLQPDTNRR